MSIKITIDEQDNREIWKLFHKYNAVLNILSYISSNEENYSPFLEKKFDEATNLYIELEDAKAKCVRKYIPSDLNYNTYYFNFEKQELIFEE